MLPDGVADDAVELNKSAYFTHLSLLFGLHDLIASTFKLVSFLGV